MSDSEMFRAKVRAMLKEGEGSIPWMYLDTVGKVTVGVGNMLPNAAAAQALPFEEADGRAANAGVIADAFQDVSAQPKGRPAGAYESVTSIRLSEQGIDDLLDQRIDEFESGLRQLFPGFDSYPDPARMGILDMAFNLGLNGLQTKFPTFTRCARNKDWNCCANQCRRTGIQESRNVETRQLFLAAAQGGSEHEPGNFSGVPQGPESQGGSGIPEASPGRRGD